MNLHTINKSPTSHSCFKDCLTVVSPDSGILLIENGVYAGLNNTASAKLIEESPCTFYAMSDDIQARGLQGRLLDKISSISYSEFVELSLQYSAVQSWY